MNEVKILVTAKNGTKPVFNEVRKDSKDLGADVAVNISEESGKKLRQDAAAGNSGFTSAADTIGDVMGRRISDRINVNVNERMRDSRGRFISGAGSGGNTTTNNRNRTTINNGGNGGSDREHVIVDVDVDKQSFLQRISALGKEASGKFSSFFSDGLKTGLTSVFSGDVLSTALKAGVITLATTVLAPAIGAATTAGVLLALGGGVIGAGVFAAIKGDPALQSSFKFLFDVAKGEALRFGKNFVEPVQHFADGLADVFNQLRPMIEQIGHDLGPVADQLGKGVIGFLQNAMPGILRAIDASTPLIQVLADNLPGIGDELGKFFDHIKNGAPEAAVFFDDLLHAIRLTIRFLGNFIEGLTEMYMVARNIVVGIVQLFIWLANQILNAAEIAFGWIPGFGPKLYKAKEAVRNFSNDVNNYLKRVPNQKTITVRFQIVGLAAANAAIRVANILGNKATGGIIGAASGGIRNGLTWVGENGPELLDAAPGSHVHSNSDSRRMASEAGGSGGPLIVQLMLDGQVLHQVLVEPTRRFVQQRFGGNVQGAYGFGG